MESNMVGWFEIPVTNMERAKKFYEAVFNITISVHDLDGLIMGWFPFAPGKSGAMGSLVQHKMYIPSDTKGPLLYFSCRDLTIELNRVEDAGGIILQAKKTISEDHGFMALLKDTEGNRIALHSQN
ncbi:MULTISPECIES: VOC family protein [Arenibacter]|uniref:VOC family protein n=1 Tax=Arenibacter TaxID=178469 RepID=UPI0004DFB2D3|nr:MULTISPECIES: VOC family protein [Arenibacter]GBF20022.1 glyoxalase-like domain protein [Arenibacter sp. NBRC 103722]